MRAGATAIGGDQYAAQLIGNINPGSGSRPLYACRKGGGANMIQFTLTAVFSGGSAAATNNATSAAVTVYDVNSFYGSSPVLHDVSLVAKEGQVTSE